MRLQDYLSDFVVLLEYDRSTTVQKFSEQLIKRAKQDRMLKRVADPEAIMAQIEEADPTKNKQYVVWLVRQFINGVQLEDLLSTVKLDLTKYQKLKDRKVLPVEHRDINKLNPIQLSKVLNDQIANAINQPSKVDKGKFKVLHDGKQTVVLRLFDEQAARFFGKNTRWCTRGEEGMENYYEHYAKDGDLFVVLPKQPGLVKNMYREKYQIHRESRQCKDAADDSYKFPSLIRKYPELAAVFSKIPEFADIPYLAADERELEAKRKQVEEARQKREAEVADLLKSLWN